MPGPITRLLACNDEDLKKCALPKRPLFHVP